MTEGTKYELVAKRDKLDPVRALAVDFVVAKRGAKFAVAEAREPKRFAPVFFADWHDWIVECEKQLAALFQTQDWRQRCEAGRGCAQGLHALHVLHG